jgi:SHAQKYF class myb-like DNA-binding protein
MFKFFDLHCEFEQPIEGTGVWTKAEHARFMMGIEMYPKGPWKKVADVVQTRSIRQVQTHAQKYREKVARWKRGLKTKLPARKIKAPAPHPMNPLPMESPEKLKLHNHNTTPPYLNIPSSEINHKCTTELPALPDCLDFFLDLLDEADTFSAKLQPAC